MKYSIYKEKNPTETVDKIKGILTDNFIHTDESTTYNSNNHNEPSSIRVNISKIIQIGTNGKGSCIENTRASAYAEFMERIQNQSLIRLNGEDYNYAPDEMIIKLSSLSYKKEIIENTENLVQICNRIYKENDKDITLLPFFNIKNTSIINLPIKFLFLFQGTNGMAAGNTIEEAFVQGFSEICERYAFKNIMLNKISSPNIPIEEYIKYDRIRHLIEFYNKHGYEICIKDASLGKKIPAVCIITKDLKNNLFFINFGAHPSLPVAIERTLTELVQGFNLDDKDFLTKLKIQGNYFSNDVFYHSIKDINIFSERLLQATAIFEYNDYLNDQFFSQNKTWNFDRNTWIDPDINNKVDNKELLRFMIQNLKDITEDNIYVRDVSFLGFPSIHIVIPSMSFLYKFDKKRISNDNNLYLWSNYSGQNEEQYNDINSLYSAIKYRASLGLSYYLNISTLPCEYIVLLCAIILKDYNSIEKYSDILIDRNNYIKQFNDNGILRIKVIKKYFEMIRQKKSKNEINEILNSLFSKESIINFYNFLESISFDYIKALIAQYRIKNNSNAQNEINKLKEIKEHLHKKYKENTPIQENLINFFQIY